MFPWGDEQEAIKTKTSGHTQVILLVQHSIYRPIKTNQITSSVINGIHSIIMEEKAYNHLDFLSNLYVIYVLNKEMEFFMSQLKIRAVVHSENLHSSNKH